MRKVQLALILLGISSICLIGCSQQSKAANSQQAIEQSKSLKTVDEQAKYLLGQANAFVNSKDFNQAIETAKYVLANLDSNSAEAKSIIEKATADMKAMALQKAKEVKKSLDSFGK